MKARERPAGGGRRAIQPHFDRVMRAVVDKRNYRSVLRDAVDGHRRLDIRDAELHHRDMVDRIPIAVIHGIGLPIDWDARRQVQLIFLQSQPQKRFHDEAVQPPGRACVPRPPAAASVRRQCIHIGGDDVRLGLVYRRRLRR